MRNTLTIARRELRAYFDHPVAYIVVVTFLAIAGWMFFNPFFLIGRADMRAFFAPSMFSPSTLLVIIVPAVTMRLVAEERKTGTIELLTTLPITDGQVILGKYVGAAVLMLAALGSTFIYAIAVASVGELDWGPVLSGYLGFGLFTLALLAIGLLMSTLTDNQIVAFIVGFILCAALYFVYWLQFFVPGAIAPVVEYLSISSHLDNMARGVVSVRDLLYYATVIGGALFLSTLSLKRQHA